MPSLSWACRCNAFRLNYPYILSLANHLYYSKRKKYSCKYKWYKAIARVTFQGPSACIFGNQNSCGIRTRGNRAFEIQRFPLQNIIKPRQEECLGVRRDVPNNRRIEFKFWDNLIPILVFGRPNIKSGKNPSHGNKQHAVGIVHTGTDPIAVRDRLVQDTNFNLARTCSPAPKPKSERFCVERKILRVTVSALVEHRDIALGVKLLRIGK